MRVKGLGGRSAARRQVGMFSRACAPRPPHVPRAPCPLPAGNARLSPSRRLRLGLSEPHVLPSSWHGRSLGSGSLARRLRPCSQRRVLGLYSPSATPLPFPALLSHTVPRESLDTKQASLRRGLENGGAAPGSCPQQPHQPL